MKYKIRGVKITKVTEGWVEDCSVEIKSKVDAQTELIEDGLAWILYK